MPRVRAHLRPWQAVVVTAVASVLGGALATAAALASRGRAGTARRLLLVSLPLGAAGMAALALLRTPWQTIAWLFLAFNLAWGTGLALLLRRWPPPPEAEPAPPGTVRQAAWLALAGALAAPYVGGGAAIVYLLATDSFISTLFPSIASRFSALPELLRTLFDFAVLGAVIGALLGRRLARLDGGRLAWALGGAVFTYFAARLCATLLLGIPAFQGWVLVERASAGSRLGSFLVSAGLVRLLTYVAATSGALLFADARSWAARARASGLLAGVVLAGVASIVVYTGRLGYDFLLAGELLEKQARPLRARPFYELGLAQRPDESIGAYLQFRLALLDRQLGRSREARSALSKVVTKYTQRPPLVARAERFLAGIEHAPAEAPRHMIDGIATRTEFKSAYCMPNSLALVLQYWHIPISPKAIGREITAIDFGTTAADGLRYVQGKGLTEWIKPLAELADIKRFVDQQVPVLVYIPQHVLAVVGYDEALNSLVTYDVAESDIWVDHPVEELIPEWKREFAILGVILPPERFAALPEAERRDFERWTRAYVHHDLHYPYHHSADAADQERALAHLEAAVDLAPEFFFDLAHILVRPRWARERERLARGHDLAAVARRGLEFTRHQFDNDEALRELAELGLDVGEYDAVHEFLARRAKEGTLEEHGELVALLGLLEYRQGNMAGAIAQLSKLRGRQRFPLMLGRAMEATGAWQPAMAEYGRVVEPESGPGERAREWLRKVRAGDGEEAAPEDGTPGSDRRAAMQRIALLAERLHDEELLRAPARAYLRQFPWDGEVQVRYAESVAATLGREGSLPADEREELRRELARTLGLLRSLDVHGRWRARVRRLETASAGR